MGISYIMDVQFILKGMIRLEQKILDMMERMYSEMQKGFSQVNNRLENLEEGQHNLKRQVTKMESDLNPKVEVALDGYNGVYEKLEVLEYKVDKLTETVEEHDVKIEVIRGVK